jgi:flagellar export protein FliJ
MQKFRFRLDSILRLREMQLEREEGTLQQMLAERARLEQSCAANAEERRQALAFVQNQPGATNTDLRALSAFLLGSQARAASLGQAILDTNEHTARQRQRVLAAERNHRLLIKLKERKHATWQHAANLELEMLAQDAWQSARSSNSDPTRILSAPKNCHAKTQAFATRSR